MKWIKVGDMIPETRLLSGRNDTFMSNRILVTDGNIIEIGFMKRDIINGMPYDSWCAGPYIDVVSHWMPLPELPKE